MQSLLFLLAAVCSVPGFQPCQAKTRPDITINDSLKRVDDVRSTGIGACVRCAVPVNYATNFRSEPKEAIPAGPPTGNGVTEPPRAVPHNAIAFLFAGQSAGPKPTTAAGQNSSATAAPKVLFSQAEQALREGRYAEAEAGFRKVLKAQPKLVPAYIDLGVVCMRTRRIDEAIRFFQTARKLAPGFAGLNLDIGLAYYQKSASLLGFCVELMSKLA